VAVAGAVLSAGLLTSCALAWPSPQTVPEPKADFGVETVSIPSGSGSTLRAWLVRGETGHGAVLLLHGAHENRLSMLARARFLHALGFTVLAPDFQAHGESPGKRITFGARESLDAAAAFAYLREAAPAERIGVIGVSMGGAAALLGQGPLKADAFVLESVYPTIAHATRARLGVWFGPIGFVGRSLTPAVISLVGRSAGVSEAELQPIDRIDEVRAPVLIVSGTKDRFTPLVEAESLYAHAPEPKGFWAIDGATHGDLHEFAKEVYERRIGEFLTVHLARPAPFVVTNAVASADSASRLQRRSARQN
jgi:pimeloyl-ACP methyl ester carboxylesterase